MSRSVPNSPRNQHELMKLNTLPPTAVLDASNTGSHSGVTASPSRRSRGASLTNFLKKLSPKLRQNSGGSAKLLKDRQPSTSDASLEEEPSTTTPEPTPTKSSECPKSSSGTVATAAANPKTSKDLKADTTGPTAAAITTTTTTTTTKLIPQSSGSGGSSPSGGAAVCVRRTQQPPKTLNILNKIVVHSPQLEMERVKNKIASVESIGSCSLDVDGTGSESSVTLDGRTSSVSQRTLRSSGGGGTSSSTPKAQQVKETTEEERATEKQHHRSGKHVSKLYIPNGHGVSTVADDDCRVDGERRRPSYIGISCSVSGYSDYSCYDSKVRQEGLRSRDNSPARLAFNNHQERHQRSRTVDIEIDELNGGLTYSSCETSKSEVTVIVNCESETKKVSSFTMWRASSEDGILNGSGSNSSINRESRTTKLGSTELLSISTSPIKSLIQQRIERLYGPGALAQGFRKHAEIKNKTNNEQGVQGLVVANGKAVPVPLQTVAAAKINGTTTAVNHSNVVNGSRSSTDNVVTPKKSGQSFIDEMNKERDRIKVLINKSEAYLKEEIPDEAGGRIRAAVGKANLLLSRKFRQFQGLCEKNLTQLPDEPFPTTVEDLTGFWDMVLIQVDDINRAFDTIEKAHRSGWSTDEIDSKHEKNGIGEGKKMKKVKAATTATKSENESALSKSRAEARRKLMELKSKGRQQKTETSSSNGIEIFVADDKR